MTNTLAIWLGFLVIAALVADQIWLEGAGRLFLARKFLDLTEYIAFWR